MVGYSELGLHRQHAASEEQTERAAHQLHPVLTAAPGQSQKHREHTQATLGQFSDESVFETFQLVQHFVMWHCTRPLHIDIHSTLY